jgi:NAD(P)-dependent dehydrogenase (short-subunit alcohol dehydrogenase family)
MVSEEILIGGFYNKEMEQRMNIDNPTEKLFALHGKVAAITGGGGVLGSALSRGLARAGACVAILQRNEDHAAALADEICQSGGQAVALRCDVLDRESVRTAADQLIDRYGKVDILINGAGGNRPQATTAPDRSFFDLPEDAFRFVFDLNFSGTLLPCQEFGRSMADAQDGVILNISSMSAFRPLTNVIAYSAAKAAVNNFTCWLAVHMAQNYSPKIRVNAIAPGFFLTEQNRFLLTEETTGALTPRGTSILAHTPMKRFGDPDDLVGAVLWLVSPASAFVTGVVVPIDGGFSAFSGV